MAQPRVTAPAATVELDLMPMNPDWVLEGAPRTRAKVLAVSQDGAICMMAWDCSAGRFKWLYSEDEIAHIISRAVVITDERGEERRLSPGDTGDAHFHPNTFPRSGLGRAEDDGRRLQRGNGPESDFPVTVLSRGGIF